MNEATQALAIESVEIGRLFCSPSNPRKNDAAVEHVAASLRRFGWRQPVVARPSGEVIDGNTRLKAAKSLGMTHVPVAWFEGTDLDATAYAIADNRTGEFAEWDTPSLVSILQDLQAEDALDGVGYGADDIQKFLDDLDRESRGDVTEDDVPEAPAETIAKPGDLFELGQHRVLCGDSTSPDHVARLMGGKLADICFTSPPYGQQRDYGEHSDVSDWMALMCGVFSALPMTESGQVLVNLGLIHREGEWVPYWDPWIEWMRSKGWRRFGWYVWDKVAAIPGDWSGRLAPRHEWVFHFNRLAVDAIKVEDCATAGQIISGPAPRGKDGKRRKMHGDGMVRNATRIRDSVCVTSKTSGGDHPAVMPVGLPSYFCESWPGDVFEPFLGSGTTLIACEQIGRSCYGMEIEPKYVDIIVARWEKLTGKKARLIEA